MDADRLVVAIVGLAQGQGLLPAGHLAVDGPLIAVIDVAGVKDILVGDVLVDRDVVEFFEARPGQAPVQVAGGIAVARRLRVAHVADRPEPAQVGAQYETGLGRLVIADVLAQHAHAVDDVAHQRMEAVLGGDVGHVDAQGLVVRRADDQLFTPVAEEVGRNGRVGLGAVVQTGLLLAGEVEVVHPAAVPLGNLHVAGAARLSACRRHHLGLLHGALSGLRHLLALRHLLRTLALLHLLRLLRALARLLPGSLRRLRHPGGTGGEAVQQLAAQVAVPPDGKVDARLDGGDQPAVAGVHAIGARAPRFPTRETGVDVGGHGPAHVGRGRESPEEFARGGVTHLGAGTQRVGFVAHPHFQARTLGDHVSHVHGIAVLELRGVEAGAVVVDTAGAVNDLVAAVSIHIADAQVVGALLLIFDPFVVIREGIEAPAPGQFAAPPVPGFKHGACVVAAADQDARTLAVEVAGPAQEAVHAVALEVAEGDAVLTGDEVGAGEFTARGAFYDREELRSLEDHAVSAGLRIEVAVVGTAVTVGVADHGAVAELGPLGRLDGQLGLAVAVEVIEDHLRVVRALADVQAQVHTPQERPVELVGVDQQALIADAGAGIVVGAGLELDHDLVLTVAVQVGHRGVVGGVITFREALDGPDGNLQIGLRAGLHREGSAGFDGRLAGEADRVGVVHGRVHLRVGVEGRARQRRIVELDLAPVEVEGHVERIALLVAPRHGHLSASVVEGDQAAVQLFFLDAGPVGGTRLVRGLPAARRCQEEQREKQDNPFHFAIGSQLVLRIIHGKYNHSVC